MFFISFICGRKKAISIASGIKVRKLIIVGSNCRILTLEPPAKSKNSCCLFTIYERKFIDGKTKATAKKTIPVT